MLLMHMPQMPYLYSGVDVAGRSWITVVLPKAFGERLAGLSKPQRIAAMRSLSDQLKGLT